MENHSQSMVAAVPLALDAAAVLHEAVTFASSRCGCSSALHPYVAKRTAKTAS